MTAQNDHPERSFEQFSHLSFSIENFEEKHHGWRDFASLPWTQPPEGNRLGGIGKYPPFVESWFNGIMIQYK